MDVKRLLIGFAAGFLATLIFHQGLAFLMHQMGALPGPPYNMAARPPFGVPSVLSISFWGGVWGVLLALLLASRPNWPAIPTAIVFGAVALTIVALTVVPLIRGTPIALFDPNRWWRGGLLNGAWGLGTVLLMMLAERVQAGPNTESSTR